MASSNLIKQLQERGLVAQVTDEEALAERLAQGPIALYCGFDPTADSLHLGHLVPLLCLKRFQQAGHKPVALVGGATGLIGDPSFKAAERKLNTEETVQEWVDKIRKQVAPFLDFDCGENSAIAANNYDWFGNMNVLTFLRDIGKHFSVNQMINKEAVKQRLNLVYNLHLLTGKISQPGCGPFSLTGQPSACGTAREVGTFAHRLPAEDAALITGDTPGAERDVLIEDFKAQRFRYLVNVAVLTTGFDAPHVDLIAILRPTESVSLYQQIVGRGLRLAPGKTDCLILDYAGNPHDLYAPEVGTPKGKSDNVPVQVFCPACGFANTFWGKTTADGTLIEHFGRRCQGWFEDDDGHREQCDFRFRFKNCPQCNAENDIAARRCRECDTVLVDPDDMLKAALRLKDALVLRCSGMSLQHEHDEKGEWLKITYYDEDGADVSERFRLQTPAQRTAFEQLFIRPHTRTPGIPLRWITAADILAQQALLRHPDFVVARMKCQLRQTLVRFIMCLDVYVPQENTIG